MSLIDFSTNSDVGRSGPKYVVRGVVLSLCIALAGGAVEAQSDVPSKKEVAAAEAALWSDPGAEALREAQDVLAAAAEAGDPVAQYQLGRHLLNGWVLDQDQQRGTQLLEAAAAANSTDAQMALAEVYLWGLGLPVDPVRAQRYLEDAAALSHPKAIRVLGDALIAGDVLQRDVARGTALLERAGAAGDVEAQLALGYFYLQGRGVAQDRDLALALFEAAAEAGNGHGLAAYGDVLMWSKQDAARAEEILNRAGELGASKAWVSLANGAMYGYLGGGSVSRAKFDGYAEKARQAGEQDIAVLEAERNMWGINMRASGPETLARLREAAEAGNGAAAGALIELQRDGNDLNIRRDRDGARASLAAFGDLFTAKKREQYALSIDAAEKRASGVHAPMAQTLQDRPDLLSPWFGAQIAKANLNLAFYMLQEKLEAEGAYDGPVNGFATRRTLEAVVSACERLSLSDHCGDDALKPKVVGRLLAK